MSRHKEPIIAALQRSGYDTITACEEASRVLAEARTELRPGQSRIYAAPTGESFTITNIDSLLKGDK